VINDEVLGFDGELARREGMASLALTRVRFEENLLKLAGVGFDAAQGIRRGAG